jgi:hypothetical protein
MSLVDQIKSYLDDELSGFEELTQVERERLASLAISKTDELRSLVSDGHVELAIGIEHVRLQLQSETAISALTVAQHVRERIVEVTFRSILMILGALA